MIGWPQTASAPVVVGSLLVWGALGATALGAQTAITVDNVVESRTGGLRFPDGTLQTRSAGPGLAPVEVTGQQTCWEADGTPIPCAGTGQDGDLQRGVAWPIPRFTDTGNGTVIDNLTGLIWLLDATCSTISPATWSDALTNANALAAPSCGLTDGSEAGGWRLPNAKELASLVDHGSASPALPAMHPFVGADSTLYWTSSTYEFNPTTARIVVLTYGHFTVTTKTDFSRAVWPVRSFRTEPGPAPVEDTGQRACWDASGNPISCTGTGMDGELQQGVDWSTPRFTDHGDGTVTDNLTSLIWLKDANCFGERSWTDALSDANSLLSLDCDLSDDSVAGDWRLPNIKELISLVDWSQSSPALAAGHPFQNVENLYWSSSSYSPTPTNAWIEGISGGFDGQRDKASAPSVFVWPVRGGQ